MNFSAAGNVDEVFLQGEFNYHRNDEKSNNERRDRRSELDGHVVVKNGKNRGLREIFIMDLECL